MPSAAQALYGPDGDWTPQERSLYAHHRANLAKGGVKNDDGSTSTVRAVTVGFGDKTYVIPTVWDNKLLSVDEAIAKAKAKGIDTFPSYGSPEEAKSRYDQLHSVMEADIR